MKNLIYKILIISILITNFVVANATNSKDTTWNNRKSNVQEFSKVVYKEFNISAFGTTNLSNKYGRMDVHTWEGNTVKIKVTILADADNQQKADETFNKININFYNDANFVKAETIIAEGSNWKMWNNDRNDYTINYDVYYPRGNFLDLSNRYGDANIGYTKGAVKVNVKYGNVNTENIDNDIECLLAYGNANIAKVGNMKGEMSYSNIELAECKDFSATLKYSKAVIQRAEKMSLPSSRYSHYEIGSVNSITYDSAYDSYEIKSIRDMSGKGKYTDINIDKLENSCDIDAGYGETRIDQVGKSFSSIRIDANYSDTEIDFGSDANYQLDASSNYGDISVPQAFKSTYHSNKDNSESIEGTHGNGSNKGRVKLKNNYADIKIK